MKKAKKLTRAERDEIAILKEKGYGVREIARAMGRSPSTISEEPQRNSVRGVYDPQKAHEKARVRKRKGKAGWRKVNKDNTCRRYVIEKLKAGWNPDEIAGRMKHDKEPFYVSKTAIYDWLRTSRGERYCVYLYSKRKQVKRRKAKKQKREMIPNRVGIQERMAGANNRTRFGHWESDAVVSGKDGSGSLAVSQERKSRLAIITRCTSMSPTDHRQAHVSVTEKHRVLSMTFDNGIENAHHEVLHECGTTTYFADPYASWQKGGVENLNKMIRTYIPKGSDISSVSAQEIADIEKRLNNKPRKILRYKTPLEVATAAGVIRSECSD